MATVGSGPGRFGTLLHRYRLTAGLSQTELAERAGVSQRGVSDLERGARRAPHPATVRRLALALGLEEGDRAALLGAARQVITVEPSLWRPPAASLPAPLTSFVGRQADLTELSRELGRSRLVTLTGAGGIGKTRLALELVRGLSTETPIGWVDMAPLGDPSLLPHLIASSLGILEQYGRPVLEGLLEALQRSSLLLVLDNCEHLVDACSALVKQLLRACPELRVLATSREALGVAGEVTWLVPPLAYLAPEKGQLGDLAGLPAVALFVERAHDRRAEFALHCP
jgi:transcriptional regulator with XRE-family HTH domain